VNEDRLISCLKEISQNFTSNRKKIADYRLDLEMVEAYAAFYLPTNIPKFSFVLDRLSSDIRAKILSSDFYDIGCGPGTYSISYLENGGTGKIFAVDNAPLMLQQMQSELKKRNFGAEVNTILNNKFSLMTLDKTKSRCLFFGNSFNEMSDYEFENYLEKVNPDILFFIEPGTSDVFTKLKEYRNTFIEKGWSVAYPCPNNLNCPMVDNDWCHQIVRFTHEPEIERLAQLIKLDRHQMPMCAHIYFKKKIDLNSQQVRIVRFLGENKFAFEYQVCVENKLIKYEFQKKKMSKPQIKHMQTLSVGDELHAVLDKEVNPNWFRVVFNFSE
jgi:ribosomal protein RSM22 (predicted rRNA methylase)